MRPLITRPASGGLAITKRAFLGGAAALALSGTARAGGGFGAAEIAAIDAASVAAGRRVRLKGLHRYAPFEDNTIYHFFGYGQSLSGGYYGNPVVSGTQPYDNLMIGDATRAAQNNSKPPITTSWVPLGSAVNGVYPFNPMIATLEGPHVPTSGETPGEGAINYLRRAAIAANGGVPPSYRFVLTNCGIGGQAMADLCDGGSGVFQRLLDAANVVKQTATSLGMNYQVGGVILTEGEQDVAYQTPYAAFLASLQLLQQQFLTQVVQGIARQRGPVPWVCHQPATRHIGYATDTVHQALLDWADTEDSDLYLAGPISQYPDHIVHLTANGYRWHANQVGKVFETVLLKSRDWLACQMTEARFRDNEILVSFYVPVPPLTLGDAYVTYDKAVYPQLGLVVSDSGGNVVAHTAEIIGQATVKLVLNRPLLDNPTVQAGYDLRNRVDWGTNLCDSDPTLADDPYVYIPGVQDPGEDIATWNGAPLIGQPYPLNNYVAIGTVPVVPG